MPVQQSSNINFMPRPFQKSDGLSAQIFEALSDRPHFLSRVTVMFAGSHSAALRKNLRLRKMAVSAEMVQIVPLSVFSIQQMLIRYNVGYKSTTEYQTRSVYLGNSILSPERFAAGFLAYLRTFKPSPWDELNTVARLFSCSSAPACLSSSSRKSAEISPIPAECFRLPLTHTLRAFPTDSQSGSGWLDGSNLVGSPLE